MGATQKSDEESDDHWALLADTHIAANKDAASRGTIMFDNLNKIIDELYWLKKTSRSV